MAEGTPFIDWGNKTATLSVLPWAAESGSTLAGRQVSLRKILSTHLLSHCLEDSGSWNRTTGSWHFRSLSMRVTKKDDEIQECRHK